MYQLIDLFLNNVYVFLALILCTVVGITWLIIMVMEYLNPYDGYKVKCPNCNELVKLKGKVARCQCGTVLNIAKATIKNNRIDD